MSKNGLILLKPTTVDKTGGGSETATISANGSVEFSACATLSLNDVFTSDYDNYRVVCRFNASGNVVVQARLRLSGADNSTANSYVYQRLEADSTTVAGARTTSNLWYWGSNNATQRSGFVSDVYGPSIAQATAFRSITAGDYLSAIIFDQAGTHNQTVAYDGFSFITSTGTITGRVAVYGMRK